MEVESRAPAEASSTPSRPPLPDFTTFGPVEVRDFSQLRQTIAKNLTAGWRTMPMVTQHDLADITELEAGRKRIVEAMPKESPKITMTVLAVKACVAALKEFPHLNSSYDMNSGKLIVKKYFHIGIAVDTKEGLVVPVIRDADKKSIRDLAADVSALAEKAKSRKLAIDEMRGGTFTISNLGCIGGTAFSPIVNYRSRDSRPRARIFSRLSRRPDRCPAHDAGESHLRSSRDRWRRWMPIHDPVDSTL